MNYQGLNYITERDRAAAGLPKWDSCAAAAARAVTVNGGSSSNGGRGL
jgi:hypothetical protein